MSAATAPADRTAPADALDLLLGAPAGDLLAAVADAADAGLGHWRAAQVLHRPGRTTVVRYDAELRRPSGTAREHVVAAFGLPPVASGAATFAAGAHRLQVWRWPADPHLPGLVRALDRRFAGALLDELGLGTTVRGLRLRAYRPSRRAVVELIGERGRLFVKVVRPRRAEDLHRRHRLLAAHLPVPDSLGWTADGMVVLQESPGPTLREALRDGVADLPAPQRLTELLDRLPAEACALPERADLLASARRHGRTIVATVPEVAALLDDVLDGIAAGSPPELAPVPVHGDLYDSQLLVGPGRIDGLLDVDTVGPGRRADDLANLCAHLSAVGAFAAHGPSSRRYGAALLADAEAHHDADDLRRRIAAALVGLATGPFRAQEDGHVEATRRWLELARAWLPGRRGGG